MLASILALSFINTASGHAIAKEPNLRANYPNVRLEVYFEALCPGCQQLTTGTLKDVLEMDDIVSILDFKITPYGNTKYSNGVFTCQHGADECKSDAYELCTQYKLRYIILHSIFHLLFK